MCKLVEVLFEYLRYLHTHCSETDPSSVALLEASSICSVLFLLNTGLTVVIMGCKNQINQGFETNVDGTKSPGKIKTKRADWTETA